MPLNKNPQRGKDVKCDAFFQQDIKTTAYIKPVYLVCVQSNCLPVEKIGKICPSQDDL